MKTRLIRYLHEKLGFDVLAFESGLYDTKVAWERMKTGEALSAFRSGVFGIWSQSQEVQPLIDYLGQRARTDRPLELSGFDSQFTASASREQLVADVIAFLRQNSTDTSAVAGWNEFRFVFDSLVHNRYCQNHPSADLQQAFFKALQQVRAVADRATAGTGDVQFWRPNLKSVEAQARSLFARPPGAQPSITDNNGRDAQMGENLVWLANERFKGRKIIVWATTGATLGFLDLRGQPASAWTRTPFQSGPLGYAPMTGNWSDVLDGTVYTKTMTRSTRATR